MNTLNRIIYYIGKRSRSVRLMYYKCTHVWLWGIIGYIRDKPNYTPTHTVSISEDEFNKIIEKVFEIHS